MKKFEYKIVEHSLSESDLNELGEQGWELIIAIKMYGYIFKREIKT